MGFLGTISAVLVALILSGLSTLNIFVALLPLGLEYIMKIYKAYRQLEQLKALQQELEDLKDDKNS